MQINDLYKLLPNLEYLKLEDLLIESDNNKIVICRSSKDLSVLVNKVKSVFVFNLKIPTMVQTLKSVFLSYLKIPTMTDKVKLALLSSLKTYTLSDAESSGKELDLLTKNDEQLNLLKHINLNSYWKNELFSSQSKIDQEINEHQEFKKRIYQIAVYNFDKELNAYKINSSQMEKEYLEYGNKLCSFSCDYFTTSKLERSIAEFNKKQTILSKIAEILPLLHKEIFALSKEDHLDLLNYLMKDLEKSVLTLDGYISTDGRQFIELFLRKKSSVLPDPRTITVSHQINLMKQIPEMSLLLKIDPNAIYILEFYIDNIERLKSVINFLSKIKIDTINSLLELLNLKYYSYSFQNFNHEQYSQIMEVLYLISTTSKDNSEEAILTLIDCLKKGSKGVPLFQANIVSNALSEITVIGTFKNESFNWLFTKPDSISYWKRHQELTLQKFPELVRSFKTWLSKITMRNENTLADWPNAIQQTQPKLQDLLSKLFKIGISNPELFKRILCVVVQTDSTKILDFLISVYSNYPTSSFIAFLQQFENHPDLISKPFSIFERNENPINSSIWKDNRLDILFKNLFTVDGDILYFFFKELNATDVISKLVPDFILDLPYDSPIGSAFRFLFSNDKTIKNVDTLSFLSKNEWSEFVNVISNFEKIYDLKTQGPIEDRLKALPERVKRDLLILMNIGLAFPNLISPISKLILQNPQLPFVEFLIKLFSKESEENRLHLINYLKTIPLKGLLLPSLDMPDNVFDGYKKVLIDLSENNNLDQDPKTLSYILLSPESVCAENVKNYTKIFFTFANHAHLNPIDGVETVVFSDGTTITLSKPVLAQTIKYGGLRSIAFAPLKKLGNLYLYMLQINPLHPGINRVISNPDCVDALKKIDWNVIRNSKRLISRILTIASWGEMSSLLDLLQWMIDNLQFGENLFDMAAAGYLPEALAIINDPKANLKQLLDQPGSLIGAAFPKTKDGIVEEETKEFHAAIATDEALQSIRSYMEKQKKVQYKDTVQKARAIETEFSFALADAMISADGHLSVISFDRLIPRMDFPKASDFGIYLRKTLTFLAKDKGFSDILDQITISSESNSPVTKIVRRMFGLSAGVSLTDRHAKVAALSALLSRGRQTDGVGSCYAASWAIISQSDKDLLMRSLEDYRNILANNCLTRVDSKENSYSYPIIISTKKIDESVLDENLLLKAREKMLGSMSATSTTNRLYQGLITQNLLLFEKNGYYQQQIEKFKNKPIAIVTINLDNIILENLRKSFMSLSKTVIEYDELHPVTNKKGFWNLARRDKQQNILTSQAYQELHSDIIQMTRKEMTALYPDHDSYTSLLLDQLVKQIQEKSFITDITNKENPDSLVNNHWRREIGGNNESLIENDLQYIGENLFIDIKANTPEEAVHYLIQYCESMPLKVKQQFLNEPGRLTPLAIPGHSLGFKPSDLLVRLAKGQSEEDILAEFNKPLGIQMKDLSEWSKMNFFENWTNLLPELLRIPFNKAIEGKNFDTLSFEEFGEVMMGALVEVYRVEPPYDLMVKLDAEMLKLSPMLDKRHWLTIADLNWDNSTGYNNCFLVCGRSALTKRLEWYTTQNQLNSIGIMTDNWVAGTWTLMQPIVRTEAGHLTYKKLPAS